MQNVELFLANKGKFFPSESLMMIKQRLENLDEDKFLMLSSIELKDPTTMLIISIVGGTLGIDRFMLGDTGIGVLKLLTGGVCGVLTIIDWFGIQKKTRQLNLEKFMLLL